jgi:hypothetical protein
MSDESLKDRLQAELKNALIKIREGADRRATFRGLASLSGNIACGSNIARLNDAAADRLVQLYAECFPENALLDAVFMVAMGHKQGVNRHRAIRRDFPALDAEKYSG